MANNMGSITQSEIEKFAAHVLRNLPLDGWRMEWTRSGSWCNRKGRIIYIDKTFIGKYPWQAKDGVLHEVAHIFSPEDRFHGCSFYKQYILLLHKFMAMDDGDLPWWDRAGEVVMD